ncbi:MAG: glycosyltransferase family 25 protein [Cytophagales bacterium]|nr:glycosyltransferase family 25 protein [Cytophagales bacterium]
MLPFRVYIVHLFRASHRRVHMDEQLRLAGITNYSYVEGVDGRKLGKADLSLHATSDAKLSFSELGCYLSHVRAWEQMDRDGVEVALILEDDVIISADLVSVLSRINKFPPNWELIHVADIPADPNAPHQLNHWGIVDLDSSYVIGTSMSYRITGLGYLVHLRGVKNILPFLRKPIFKPVDHMLFEYSSNYHFFHSIKPSLVFLRRDIKSELRNKDSFNNLGEHLNWQTRIAGILSKWTWNILSFFPVPAKRYTTRREQNMLMYFLHLLRDYFFRRR